MSKRLACPHCRSACDVRTSRELTPLCRETYYQCTNVFCGCTFKAQMAIICMIVASATPNPEIRLPLAPSIKPPAPANDDGLEVAATG